jgi:hypothetical protein
MPNAIETKLAENFGERQISIHPFKVYFILFFVAGIIATVILLRYLSWMTSRTSIPPPKQK